MVTVAGEKRDPAMQEAGLASQMTSLLLGVYIMQWWSMSDRLVYL